MTELAGDAVEIDLVHDNSRVVTAVVLVAAGRGVNSKARDVRYRQDRNAVGGG